MSSLVNRDSRVTKLQSGVLTFSDRLAPPGSAGATLGLTNPFSITPVFKNARVDSSLAKLCMISKTPRPEPRRFADRLVKGTLGTVRL